MIQKNGLSTVSVKVRMDYRRQLNSGLYPVKLFVRFHGKVKALPTGIYLSREEWRKIHSPRLRDERLEEIGHRMKLIWLDARQTIKRLDREFSIDSFVFLMTGQKPKVSKKKTRTSLMPSGRK